MDGKQVDVEVEGQVEYRKTLNECFASARGYVRSITNVEVCPVVSTVDQLHNVQDNKDDDGAE